MKRKCRILLSGVLPREKCYCVSLYAYIDKYFVSLGIPLLVAPCVYTYPIPNYIVLRKAVFDMATCGFPVSIMRDNYRPEVHPQSDGSIVC